MELLVGRQVCEVSFPVFAQLLSSELVQRQTYLKSSLQVGIGTMHEPVKYGLEGQWD